MLGEVAISLLDGDAVRVEVRDSAWFGFGLGDAARAQLTAGKDDPATGQRVVERHANTWNAITHAVCMGRIVENGALTPHPATIEEHFARLDQAL